MPRTKAHALRQFRNAAQLTQVALSELSGVNERTISRIENGGAAGNEVIDRLAEALSRQIGSEISSEELTGGDKQEKKRLTVTLTPEVAQKLDEIRQQTGLTQADLARQAIVDISTVRRFNEGAPVRFATASKIAKALDIDPSELLVERPDALQGKKPPIVPAQTRSAHFTIESGVVEAVPTQAIEQDKNDYRRLAALHEPLLSAVSLAEQELERGNQPFGLLLENVRKYRKVLDSGLEDINYAQLYAYGLSIDISYKAAQREIRSGDLPEFDMDALAATESLSQLHGPFILSSGDGRDLVIDAERYSRSPDEEREFQENMQSFGRILSQRTDIVEQNTSEFIEDITASDDGSEAFERRYVFTRGAAKNLIIVLSAGAVVASTAFIPTVGPFIAASLGLVGLEALKKSDSFKALSEPVRDGLDGLSKVDLERISNIPKKQLEKVREFVKSNKDIMRSVGGNSGEMKWFRDVLDWIGASGDGGETVELRAIEMEASAVPLADIEKTIRPIYAGRLTLKALRQLPEGAFIQSNSYGGDGPLLLESLGDRTPEEIYAIAKQRRVQGNRFYAFESQEHYVEFVSARDRIAYDVD